MADAGAFQLAAMGLSALLAIVNAFVLFVLSGLRSDVRDIKSNVREDMARGSRRMQELDARISDLAGRQRVVERICERNHNTRQRRTDPEEFDPSIFRTHNGERSG